MISAIRIGDRVTFKPFCFFPVKLGGRGDHTTGEVNKTVTGTVVYINRPHHWFRVRYEAYGCEYHECFPMPVPPSPEPERMEPYTQNKTLDRAKAWCDKFPHSPTK